MQGPLCRTPTAVLMLRTLAVLLLATAPALAQDAEPISLPAAADSALSAAFPGWHYAPAYEEAVAVHRWYDERNWPWLWEGDFDRDGLTDYVSHIAYADTAGSPRESVVTLLQRGRGFSVVFVGVGGGHQTLWVLPRGSELVQEEWGGLDKPVLWRFESDAIQLAYDGKPASEIWVWHDGRFVSVFELIEE